MELLILPLLEIVTFFATALIPAVFELVFAVLGLLGELIGALVSLAYERRKTKPDAAPDQHTETAQQTVAAPSDTLTADEPSAWSRRIATTRKWTRRLAWVSCGLLVVSGLVFIAIQQLAFEPTIRMMFGELKATNDIEISFDRAEGNFATGKLQLRGVRIWRTNSRVSNFDIRMGSLDLDVDISALAGGELLFESVHVAEARGEYHRVGSSEPNANRKPYIIQDLQVQDVDVTVKWRTQTVPVEVARLQASPLRSEWSAFDVMFRSNGTGKVYGQDLNLTSAKSGVDVESTMTATGLPVEKALRDFGGPFKWLTNGGADLRCRTAWRDTDDDLELQSEWSISLNNVKAGAPDDASRAVKVAAFPVVVYLNRRSKPLQTEFSIPIAKSMFQGQTWPITSELFSLTKSAAVAVFKRMLKRE